MARARCSIWMSEASVGMSSASSSLNHAVIIISLLHHCSAEEIYEPFVQLHVIYRLWIVHGAPSMGKPSKIPTSSNVMVTSLIHRWNEDVFGLHFSSNAMIRWSNWVYPSRKTSAKPALSISSSTTRWEEATLFNLDEWSIVLSGLLRCQKNNKT